MGVSRRQSVHSLHSYVSMNWRVLLLLAVVAVVCTGENAPSSCTTGQNTAKTDSAQAVLDCGTSKCSKVKGRSQQTCLCKHCAAENKKAEAASCACGLSDENSKAACQIYQRLNAKCSGASHVHTSVGVMILFVIANFVAQWH